MNSWRVSACYPRRTFYPLSDGPSIQNHRITMTVFRLCSTCQSRSQAGLCHCTQRSISDRSEPTFARLRYSFGGGPPQSNYPPYSVLQPDDGLQLDIKNNKRGISTDDSILAGARTSKSPSYATYVISNTNVKL